MECKVKLRQNRARESGFCVAPGELEIENHLELVMSDGGKRCAAESLG